MNEISMAQTPARDWRTRLAGTGPLGIVACTVILFVGCLISPLIGSVLVLLWAWLARLPFSELGFAPPSSWLRAALYGIALGIGLKLAMKVLVLPLLGAEAVNQQFHFVQGNPGAALGMSAFALVAAFTEETFFRGYLFERVGAWLGREQLGAAVAVVFSSMLFGTLHFQQGRLGITNATIVGAVSALIYLANRRRLFLLMVMHATFDIVSVGIIYFGLERQIGGLLFGGS